MMMHYGMHCCLVVECVVTSWIPDWDPDCLPLMLGTPRL